MAAREHQLVILGMALLCAALTVLLTLGPSLTGKATTATRVNITNSTPINCSAIAYTGYNTISIPCITTATPLTDIVDPSGVWAFYQYVPGSQDLWRVYNPNLPSYVVLDLEHLSRRVGYIAIMNSTQTINYSGLAVYSTNVPIVAGWNLIGYPTLDVQNASLAFFDINASFTEVRTYNNTQGVYLRYVNPSGGTLNVTRPGEGYWINATSAASWTVFG